MPYTRGVMARYVALAVVAASLVVSGAARADVSVAQCLESSEQGQKLRDEGKLSQARDLFRTCSATACPAPVRKSCVKWHEQVVETMPSIIVVARDPKDADVLGAEVSIDGGEPEPISGRGLRLDPGTHTVTVRAKDHADAETRVIVNLNEKNRSVKLTLEPVSPSEPKPEPTPATEPAPEPRRRGRHLTPITYVFGGAAVASFAGSLVLGLTTRAARDDLVCAPTSTCTSEDTSGLRARFIMADVLLGVGVAAALAAVWSYVASGSSPTASTQRWEPGFTF